MRSEKNFFLRDKDNYKLEEAFKVVRTNLHFLDKEKRSRTILITSSIPKEGKSTIASDYAISIGTAGGKVLLIDCDIRRPSVYERFKISFEKGLESILSEECKLESVILKNVEKNLDVLPTNNIFHNSTEFFLGEKIKMILQEVKEKYDTVILDTSPLTISSDAAILSTYCDGVVYVVGYNQVNKKELEFGKTMLDNAKANIYGFIVNKIDKNGFLYANCGYYNNNYHSIKIENFPKVHIFQKKIKSLLIKLKNK